AVVERAGRWHVAYSPEIPGANGQGRTKAAALKSLKSAIALILDDRARTGCEVYRRQRGERRSSSGEAGRPASPSATPRMPSKTRRTLALALDEPDDRRGRSRAAIHRNR